MKRYSIDILHSNRPHVVADAVRLPLLSGTVDAVSMFELLEHVADPYLAIEEARRVLREGGVLLGSVPFLFPVHSDPYERRARER